MNLLLLLVCSVTLLSTFYFSSLFSDQSYQVDVRHIEWKGIGYNNGYTTLQGFFAPSVGAFIPFVDLRGHVFNNGKLAANAGCGVRYLIDPSTYMVGVNAYYDYRKTEHFHYNQIGAGVEACADRWEFRANGYLPVGDKITTYSNKLQGISFERFEGHYLMIFEHYKQKQEFAMKGFNAEVGVHPLKIMRDDDLYVSVGPYYFHAEKGDNAWGGKMRVSVKVMKYLFLEISDSYDQVFHNRFQGQVSISIPFGRKKLHATKNTLQSSCFAENVMRWRGCQPVQRQEIIVVNRHTKHHTVDPPAINPATNQPYYFVFVNNTNVHPAPNGTFENPFANLSTLDGALNAQDASIEGNIIYVFSGDGTATHMTSGVVLKSSQRFLGSAVSHSFVTTKGTVVVLPQTGVSPHIANVAASPPVQLVDSNEVSGFSIRALAGAVPAIVGPVSGATTITRNFLAPSGTKAMDLSTTSLGSNTLVDSNQMVGGGIRIVHNGPCTATITNNLIERGGILTKTGGGSTATVLVSGNEVYGTTGRAIEHSVMGPMSVKIFNNWVHDTRTGIALFAVGNPGLLNVEVANNVVTNNLGNGVIFQNHVTGAVLCARLVNNISTGNGGNAYLLDNDAVVGATLYLEPASGNVGTITTMGTITPMAPCGCAGCP